MNDWDDAERRVEKAQELFEQHRWLEALEELRAATSINPYNGGWFFNIGLTLDEMGRFDEAIEAYRHVLEIDPDDLQALHHLGVDQHRIGNFAAALGTFEAMEAVDCSFEPSYCYRIITYSDLGDHEKAEEMFYLARLYKEHCPHCYYNIGCSLRDRGEFDRAIYCWQKTLDLDEVYPQVQIRIAEAFWGKGELESSRQHYLVGLRQDPGNIQTLLDLGKLLMEMGRVEEAGEKFRRAFELAPEEPGGYFCHGEWLMRAKRYDEALLALARVLQLDPTYPGAHLLMGEIHFARRELVATRKHLRAEVLLRPQDPDVLLALSKLLADSGQPRAAVACLKRLTQLDSKHVTAWQNLAVALFMLGRYDEGISASRRAIAHCPRNTMVLYNLSLAYERLGRYREARVWARRGLRVDPDDASLQSLDLRIRLLAGWETLKGVVLRLLGRKRAEQPTTTEDDAVQSAP